MDPPYTNEGLRLFLKRAKQVLKTSINIEGKEHKVIGKKCLLCFGNKPPKVMQQIQLSILDHGFVIKNATNTVIYFRSRFRNKRNDSVFQSL